MTYRKPNLTNILAIQSKINLNREKEIEAKRRKAEAEKREIEKQKELARIVKLQKAINALEGEGEIENPDKIIDDTPPIENRFPNEHCQFGKLMDYAEDRENIYLVGPAGTGKTQAAHNLAKYLGLPFYAMPVSDSTTAEDLLGYRNAMGEYVRTQLRDAVEHGGVILFDEFDYGSAAGNSALNNILANNFCAFPDKVIQKHKDFICIVSANTFGTGPNEVYMGGNQLNPATLNRFVTIHWDYDEALELRITPRPTFTRLIQKIRKVVLEMNLHLVVSTRSAIMGGKRLNKLEKRYGRKPTALELREVLMEVLYRDLDELTINQIEAKLATEKANGNSHP